jgi:uncharacterized membrane protein YkgB
MNNQTLGIIVGAIGVALLFIWIPCVCSDYLCDKIATLIFNKIPKFIYNKVLDFCKQMQTFGIILTVLGLTIIMVCIPCSSEYIRRKFSNYFKSPKPLSPKSTKSFLYQANKMDLKQCEYCLKVDEPELFTYIFKEGGRLIMKICPHCHKEYKSFNVTVLPPMNHEKWKIEIEEITKDPRLI